MAHVERHHAAALPDLVRRSNLPPRPKALTPLQILLRREHLCRIVAARRFRQHRGTEVLHRFVRPPLFHRWRHKGGPLRADLFLAVCIDAIRLKDAPAGLPELTNARLHLVRDDELDRAQLALVMRERASTAENALVILELVAHLALLLHP